MEESIKINAIFALRKRFVLLYLLNFTDAVFTRTLLKTGVFLEVNPVMNKIAYSNFKMIIVKILLPLLLLSVVYNRVKKSSINLLIISNKILLPVITFYLLINVIHITGVILYFIFPLYSNITFHFLY